MAQLTTSAQTSIKNPLSAKTVTFKEDVYPKTAKSTATALKNSTNPGDTLASIVESPAKLK